MKQKKKTNEQDIAIKALKKANREIELARNGGRWRGSQSTYACLVCYRTLEKTCKWNKAVHQALLERSL